MWATVDSLSATVDLAPPPAICREYNISSDEGDWQIPAGLVETLLARHQAKPPDDADTISAVVSLSDRESEPYVAPRADLAKKQAKIASQHLMGLAATKVRIDDLKSEAQAEGYAVSAASEKDLFTFLDTKVFTRRPLVTLLDNGNLRVLWRNAEGEQIGLQFRGNKQVQYVLFARRQTGNFIARSSGRDTLANIGRQIDVNDLARLMTT
jgi:hypothetical protein